MSALLMILAQERGQDPALVAPGFGAFLTFFALALVCVAIGFSMTRRVRRSQHRNAERARAAADDRPGPDSEGVSAAGTDPAADAADRGEHGEQGRQGA